MRELIKEKALEIGFDAVGFTEPSLDNKISRFMPVIRTIIIS